MGATGKTGAIETAGQARSMEGRSLVYSVVFFCLALCLLSGCAPKAPVVQAPAPPTPAQRLASADALVRAGCLECLIDAYGQYDLLRAFPYAKDAATLGAIRAAGLIARRQRELGMTDEGYLTRARTLATTIA